MVPDRIGEYYIVCSLTVVFFLIAMAVSLFILILVYKTKPRLHTVRHLLICNTAVASILFCIVQINNYVFLLFIPEDTSDMSCRWRGYFAYITLCGVAYSFLIQAVSRLFISVFSTQYRWLTTFKIHYMLICTQWIITVIVPLPTITTKDVNFHPNALCYVPLRRLIHAVYTYVVYYISPTISICIIYIFIYYRMKQTANSAQILVRSIHNNKRDLIVLRNIVILLAIYLMGGVPSLLFLVTASRVLYLMGIVSIAFAVALEKVCTLLLDEELIQVVKRVVLRKTPVVPFNNTQTMLRDQKHISKMPRIVVETIH